MENFYILLNQMVSFVVLLLIGAVGAKAKVLTKSVLASMSRIVMQICMPFMMFSTIMANETADRLLPVLPVFFITFALLGLLWLLGLLGTKLLKQPEPRARLYLLVSTCGNAGFIGIPIMTALLPQTGGLYIAMYFLAEQLILWTLLVRLSYPKKTEKLPLSGQLKLMLNPNIVALSIGIVVLLLQTFIPSFRFPELLLSTFSGVGSITPNLAMIYIGGLIALSDRRSTFYPKDTLLLIGVKMIAAPLLVFMITKLFLPLEMATAIGVITALPSMMAASMLANMHGSDEKYAAGMTLCSTIASIVTVPLAVFLFSVM